MPKEKRIRRVNNLKAPRFIPKKYTTELINKALYVDWKKKNPEYSYITYSDFLEIWWMMCEVLIDWTVSETEGIRLPYYVGEFFVQYVRTREPLIDKKLSDKVGYDVEEDLSHSDGKTGKIIYCVSHVRKKNNSSLLYGFEACIRFRHKARKCLKYTPERFKDSKLARWQNGMLKKLHG